MGGRHPPVGDCNNVLPDFGIDLESAVALLSSNRRDRRPVRSTRACRSVTTAIVLVPARVLRDLSVAILSAEVTILSAE